MTDLPGHSAVRMKTPRRRPKGRALLESWKAAPEGAAMAMDRAYQGNENRQVLDLGMTPVVPQRANRVVKWDYDRLLYQRRNKVERLFRRLKGHRRIFSRFEKRNPMYRAFLNIALIVNMMTCEHALISGLDFK